MIRSYLLESYYLSLLNYALYILTICGSGKEIGY